MIRQLSMWACSLLYAVTANAEATGVLKLSLDSKSDAQAHVVKAADGSTLGWTEYFKSKESNVAVGRSDVNGTLPPEHLAYTDCFFIARGSATVTVEGKEYAVHKGEIVLLPRGAQLAGKDFKDYVHFAASFESQPNARSNGPLELRRLRPDLLKDSDFVTEGHNMRHVYYQGASGVVVRAWQSTDTEFSTAFFASPWSELSFVTAGTGTITNEDGSIISLKPGDTFLITKGQRLKLTTHKLRKLAVVFDETAPITTAQ